jgi:hypothetical protein
MPTNKFLNSRFHGQPGADLGVFEERAVDSLAANYYTCHNIQPIKLHPIKW